MASDLEFRGLTLDRFVCDRPSALERTYLECQPRRTICANPGRSDERFAEIDQVGIDQAPTPIDEHPVEIVVHTVGTKACCFHNRRIGRAVRSRDRDVEIFVLTRLMAEER